MDAKEVQLQSFAYAGNVNEVRYMIGQMVNMNAKDRNGNTALHYAARGNKPQVLQLLINYGANINAVNNDGCTALHEAVYNRSANCVTVLLFNNIYVNKYNNEGLTELMLAIQSGENTDEVQESRKRIIIEDLVKFKHTKLALISDDKQRQTAFHYAALCGNLFAVNIFLEKGCTLHNIPNAFRNLPIHIAAAFGRDEVITTILRKIPQLSVNITGHKMRTPLHMAVFNGRCSTVELLLKLKADCNQTDRDGETCLHSALLNYKACCYKSRRDFNCCWKVGDCKVINDICESMSAVLKLKCVNLAIALYLVEKGNANINIKNNFGETVLDLVKDDKEVYNKIKASFEERSVVSTPKRKVRLSQEGSCKKIKVTKIDSSSNDSQITINNNKGEISKCACDCSEKMKTIIDRLDYLENLINQMRENSTNSDAPTVLCECDTKTSVTESSNIDCETCNLKANYVLLCGHNYCETCYDKYCDCVYCDYVYWRDYESSLGYQTPSDYQCSPESMSPILRIDD
ncbi:E3 ubiquitin-protein ligase MIB2-like isoform X2 [Leptotrombidium deliense]|uniref:Alpha-latrotoxin n=1 Tax=Leptotrombidium deliense TaxID=299467 RepID=A0A443S752_9ACAR|nr:E3 ubiquitin-protein ligase MIB2-like isoform X2 [Leptotrombidium deliense]